MGLELAGRYSVRYGEINLRITLEESMSSPAADQTSLLVDNITMISAASLNVSTLV